MKRPAPPKLNLLFGSVLGIAVAYLVTVGCGNSPKLELSISQIIDVHNGDAVKGLDFRFPIDDPENDVVVVMRARNPCRALVMFGKQRIQTRVEGCWLEVEDVSWLNSKHFVATLPAGSEEEFVIAVVPRHAEALRLFVDYRQESLIDNWHRLCGYQASAAQTSSFPKLICGFFVSLDRWIIEPLRKHSLAAQWPRLTVEFSLSELLVHPAKQRHDLERGYKFPTTTE